MSDQLLDVLRICLLVLLYLVFLRVVRAVWVEIRASSPERVVAPRAAPVPVGAGAAAPPRRGGRRGTVQRVAVLGPATVAGARHELRGETTIGRAPGCAVMIDDPTVSKLHARVFPGPDGWLVEDLGSTNGTSVDGRAVTAPAPVVPGSRVVVGEVVLEFS